jgi:hypothetical protein
MKGAKVPDELLKAQRCQMNTAQAPNEWTLSTSCIRFPMKDIAQLLFERNWTALWSPDLKIFPLIVVPSLTFWRFPSLTNQLHRFVA